MPTITDLSCVKDGVVVHTTLNDSGNSCRIGPDVDSNRTAFFRFQLNIPRWARIVSAWLNGQAVDSSTGSQYTQLLYCEDVDSSADWGGSENLKLRTFVWNSAYWSSEVCPAQSAGDAISLDVRAPLQGVVIRPGWEANNYILLAQAPVDEEHGDDNWGFATNEHVSYEPPTLNVEYSDRWPRRQSIGGIFV